MTSTLLQCQSVQQLLMDLCHLGFSAAIARFINSRSETVARVRTPEQ